MNKATDEKSQYKNQRRSWNYNISNVFRDLQLFLPLSWFNVILLKKLIKQAEQV